MYAIASSCGSATPRRRMWWLLGIHMPPADFAVVPPITAPFSSTTTRAPASTEARALTRPAAPDPATTMSTSSLQAGAA